MNRTTLLVLLASATIAAGCQSKDNKPDTTVPEVIETRTETQVQDLQPVPPPRVIVERPQAPDPFDTKIIFFEFDRSEIKPEFRPVVEAHAQWLADNPSNNVRLEGHADERGSREYNIGLGERRAQSVRKALLLLGVRSGQIETRSYGEEKPLHTGSGEYSWSQNRRVEFVAR